MPETITLGHAFMLAGLIIGLIALFGLGIWFANRGHGPGTPGYAQARDGRRMAAYTAVTALVLYLVGCFTPLADIAI